MFRNEPADAAHIRQQRFVARFFDRAVQRPDHTGQQRHRAKHAQDYALAHHNAQVFAQGETHEADAHKAGDRGQGGAQDGSEGQPDGIRHGFILVVRQGFLLLVAVPQENGIVQRHSQLQHGSHRLGDIADLAQEIIAAHVPQNGNSNAEQEDQRQQERVHGQHQHNGAQRYGNGDIDRFLVLHQLPGIGHDRGKAAYKGLFTGNLPYLTDSFHGFLRGGTFIKEDGGKHTVAPLELLPNIIRDDFHGQRSLRQ